MAVTYQSVQSNSSTDSDLVITKPVSLAVDDQMLAGIYFSDDNSGSGGINTPSGWTLLSTTNTGAPTHEVLAIFSKVADSSDVAASDFTFTRSGGDSSYHLVGHILRITGVGSNVGSTSNSSTGVASVVLTGFTPSKADTLMVAFIGNSAASTVLNTSIALTTDNPSWTEVAETSYNDSSRDSTLSVYVATRSQTTATGDVTATSAGVVAAIHSYVIALSSRVDGSHTPVDTKLNAYAFNPYNPSVQADAVVDNPVVNDSYPTQWTPQTKTPQTWTPQTK